MSCLTDSLVDPPHLHLKSTEAFKNQVGVSESNNYFGIIPLQMKLLRKDSLLSLFSWATKNEAGDFLHEHSVDEIAHSVDPVVYRRVSNSKRGPSPPSRGPSPPPNLASSKLPSVLARSSRCNSESDVDRGIKKIDTNIDTGRDESTWLNLLMDDSVDGEFGYHVEAKRRPRNRRPDFGDSVDRKGSVESLSYPVDARSSFTNASETSAKDWEPHEAESLLSQIYDLGDDCICLMHPCICSLDENSFPEPPSNRYTNAGRKSRAPRKQVSQRIRQREMETMKTQQLGYAAVNMKEMDGTSTDLHYHSSSHHRDITQDGTKLSAKVSNKMRISPYELGGTNVDLGSREEHAELKNLSALLLNDPTGQGVHWKSRLEILGASVDGHVNRVSPAYSTAVDFGDNVHSAQSFTVDNAKCRDKVLICMPSDSASDDADMTPAARMSTVEQSVDGSMENDMAKPNRKTDESMAAADSSMVVDNTVVTSEQGVQATLVTLEPPYEVANDFVSFDSETPRMPDVMYDDSMGDCLERISQGHSYSCLPHVFDALCFGAQNARSTNVDDTMAADNGSERRYDQIFRRMSSGREHCFAEFLPDDAVDGSYSEADHFNEAIYGMAVDGSPGRPSTPRRCRSDPDMQGSKTDPCHCNLASFPSAKSLSRTSRIPRRVLKPRVKSSEHDLPSEQEQKQMRSPKPLQHQLKSRKPQEHGQQGMNSARPPSEEGQDPAFMCRSPISWQSLSPASPLVEGKAHPRQESKNRDNIRDVINSDFRSKPYVPQVITFYTHRDSKVATTIPPATQVRKLSPVKTPDLPPWNPSTLVEKHRRYSRPQPLHYKHESVLSLVSNASECSKTNLPKEVDSMERISQSPNEESPSDGTATVSALRNASPTHSPSKKPPAYPHPRQPFKPAGVAPDKKRPVPPPYNSARCVPQLRVPGGKVQIPVVYPCMKSESSTSRETRKEGGEEEVPEGAEGEAAQKLMYSPGPDRYHYPAYTASAPENNNPIGDVNAKKDAVVPDFGSIAADGDTVADNAIHEIVNDSNVLENTCASNSNNSNSSDNNAIGNKSSSSSVDKITPENVDNSRRNKGPPKDELNSSRAGGKRVLRLPGVTKATLGYLKSCAPDRRAPRRGIPSQPKPSRSSQELQQMLRNPFEHISPLIYANLEPAFLRAARGDPLMMHGLGLGDRPVFLHLPTADLVHL